MSDQEHCSTVVPAELAAQARAAYDKNHMRECLALTKALALADPGNAEALALQSAIQWDIHQSLNDARALLEDVSKEDGEKYRKAAEIILMKTLHLDPENKAAKVLLQNARGFAPSAPPPSPPPQPDPHPHPARQVVEAVPFTAASLPLERQRKKGPRLRLPGAFAVIVIVVVTVFLVLQSRPVRRDSIGVPAASTQPVNEPPKPFAAPIDPMTPQPSVSASAPASSAPAIPLSVVAQQPVANKPPAVDPVVKPVVPPTPKVKATASAGLGKLAVSSPTPADIYVFDKYLGSTPTTIELPSGRQTLEYRHRDLRTFATYDITAGETMTAAVTFQISVQINSKPWADVFLDGATRRPLGQTPLSSVAVPIGGVLIFENPGFRSKSYRITEKDTAIQINFP